MGESLRKEGPLGPWRSGGLSQPERISPNKAGAPGARIPGASGHIGSRVQEPKVLGTAPCPLCNARQPPCPADPEPPPRRS